MEDVNNTGKISVFNSGLKIIDRLDDLWKKTHTYSCSGRYRDWNNTLDRVWCELARDLNEEKYKKREVEIKNIDNNLAKIGEILNGLDDKIGFQSATDNDIANRKKQYKLLMEKDLFLRRLENELGKGSKWEDEGEDDWE